MAKNKYGLSRNIPLAIKKQIRFEAGFGCVICGSAIYTYEHIDPEWYQAKSHEPDKMTLLCPEHHYKVTNRIISKSQVWLAKRDPITKKRGFIQDGLYCDFNSKRLLIGSNIISPGGVGLNVASKPLIWFEQPDDFNEPPKLCIIFYNNEGIAIAYINRNEYIGLIADKKMDFNCSKTKIKILFERKLILEIDRQGDSIFKILNLSTRYGNTEIHIEGKKLFIDTGSSSATFIDCEVQGGNNSIQVGSRPQHGLFGGAAKDLCFKLIFILYLLSIRGIKIFSYNGNFQGYLLDDYFFCKDGIIVGKRVNNKVYLLSGEFIGFYSSGFIGINTDSYEETQEPIWINPKDKATYNLRNKRPIYLYDLSYRLFGLSA